jgi:hypothetical protein
MSLRVTSIKIHTLSLPSRWIWEIVIIKSVQNPRNVGQNYWELKVDHYL